MAWLELQVGIAGTEVTGVSDALILAGADAVDVTSDNLEEVYQLDPGLTHWWSECVLRILWPFDKPILPLKNIIEEHSIKLLSVEFVAEIDWTGSWKNHSTEQLFGDRLWVLPKHVQSRAKTSIHLDPGLAFGSGSHQTTQLCLEWIAQHDWLGRNMMDYGCGSGILGIAAASLGASQVVALDHDIQAIQATEQNAAFNHCSGNLSVYSELPEDVGSFDVVIANILLNPLLELASLLQSILKRNGFLVLSGFSVDQLEHIILAYTNIEFDTPTQLDDWVCVAGRLIESADVMT